MSFGAPPRGADRFFGREHLLLPSDQARETNAEMGPPHGIGKAHARTPATHRSRVPSFFFKKPAPPQTSPFFPPRPSPNWRPPPSRSGFPAPPGGHRAGPFPRFFSGHNRRAPKCFLGRKHLRLPSVQPRKTYEKRGRPD